MSLVGGAVVITAADVQVALDETDPQACWLLNEDGSTFTAWIPDVEPFRPPAWPRYLSTVDATRKQIERHTTIREKVSTSVDLPLTHECKRVLAYGADRGVSFDLFADRIDGRM